MRMALILAATVLGVTFGPAGLAAADPQNPLQVIEQLELAGYSVNLDPIRRCFLRC